MPAILPERSRSSTVKIAALVLAVALSACRPSELPRETARGTVLTLARAVQVADVTCASIATARQDAKLAETCAGAYDVARDALIGAESGVDAWDEHGAGNVPCAVARAAASLASIASAVEHAGGEVPAVVDDALRLAPELVGSCHE